MTGAGARRANATAGSARAASPSASKTIRIGGAVAICGLLAACSAHERTADAPTPQPVQPVSLTATLPAAGQAGVPIPQPAPSASAAATPARAAATVPNPAAQPSATSARKLGRSGGGLASWYGDRFHGRSTANGERFNMGAFTAAHRSFPLPSYVRVTNVSNGRSMVVRVNDRGPFHGNRVIDVSKRAADVLGFRGHGVGNVKLDYIGPAPKSGSDDRKLLASFQEFGQPTTPPGMQVAALGPVSDAQLAQEASGGGAYQLASAAFDASAAAISYSASAVASGAKAAASGAKAAATKATDVATSATTAVRNALPHRPAPAPQPVTVAAVEPAPAGVAAYAAPAPMPGAPAELVDPSAKNRRVVKPEAPAFASSVPAPAGRTMDVSSRIASSFEGFGGSSTQVTTGASVSFEAGR